MPTILLAGHCYAELAVFFASGGCNLHKYSLCLPANRWPMARLSSPRWLVTQPDGSTCPKDVTHPTTNWAQHRATLLIETPHAKPYCS